MRATSTHRSPSLSAENVAISEGTKDGLGTRLTSSFGTVRVLPVSVKERIIDNTVDSGGISPAEVLENTQAEGMLFLPSAIV